MNELKVFENSQFGKLNIMIIDGKEYFPATDCAKVLGYSNPHKAIGDHCRALTKREVIDNLGRTQEMNFIPEGDFYRLIARSKLPAAGSLSAGCSMRCCPPSASTAAISLPTRWRKPC